jgi:hypothetical protein
MISNTGMYWSTGITVHQRADTHGWAASLDFLDDGFVNDDPDEGRVSTEGTLRTRYFVRGTGTTSGLSAAIDALVTDAAQLGIAFRDPSLYYKGDGELEDYPAPDGWRETLAREAERIGWRTIYTGPQPETRS